MSGPSETNMLASSSFLTASAWMECMSLNQFRLRFYIREINNRGKDLTKRAAYMEGIMPVFQCVSTTQHLSTADLPFAQLSLLAFLINTEATVRLHSLQVAPFAFSQESEVCPHELWEQMQTLWFCCRLKMSRWGMLIWYVSLPGTLLS